METSKVNFRCGADPEIFLVDVNGKHISAIGLIGADKYAPLQIPEMKQGYTLQEDNVALEYGIPPAATADEFVKHIQAVMQKSKEWIPKGVTFSKLSCTIFEKDQMQHPMAHVFGCEPDFNAWTLKENVKPTPPHKFMRSAGGHIHVETKQNPELVVRRMDLYLGVPSVLMDSGQDRRQLYGAMGAYRKKPYGVEYRVLSNFWIFDEKYIKWAWNATERALDSRVLMDDNMYTYLNIAINHNDRQMARALVNEFNLEVV